MISVDIFQWIQKSPREFNTTKKEFGQLKNGEIRINCFLGTSTPNGYPTPNDQPENVHNSNTVQTDIQKYLLYVKI